MLHDIAPHVLSNAYSPRAPQGEDPALCFDPEGVYLKGGGFPTCADYPAGTSFQYLFDYDGSAVFLADRIPMAAQRQPHRALRSLRPFWAALRCTCGTGIETRAFAAAAARPCPTARGSAPWSAPLAEIPSIRASRPRSLCSSTTARTG